MDFIRVCLSKKISHTYGIPIYVWHMIYHVLIQLNNKMSYSSTKVYLNIMYDLYWILECSCITYMHTLGARSTIVYLLYSIDIRHAHQSYYTGTSHKPKAGTV
jgi:hypothetical protein